MLGISNVILEETGMIEQCREPMGLQRKKTDLGALGNKHLWQFLLGVPVVGIDSVDKF
jgi:hypothetical protein